MSVTAWLLLCVVTYLPALLADEGLQLPCPKQTEGCVVVNGKKSCPMDKYRTAKTKLLHYLRPAKTASTAMSNAIACSQVHTPTACAPLELHTSHQFTADQLPPEAISFTVLRDPCERFGSGFRYIRQTACIKTLRDKLEEIDKKRFKRPAQWRRIRSRHIKAAFPSEFKRCNSGGGGDDSDGDSESAPFGSPMELLWWFGTAQAKVCNGSMVCSGTFFEHSFQHNPKGAVDIPPWPPTSDVKNGNNRTSRSMVSSSFRTLSLLQPQAAYTTTAPGHSFACLGAGHDHAKEVQNIFNEHVPGCNLMAMAIERSSPSSSSSSSAFSTSLSSSSSPSTPWSRAYHESGTLCAAVRKVYADDARLWAEHCAVKKEAIVVEKLRERDRSEMR